MSIQTNTIIHVQNERAHKKGSVSITSMPTDSNDQKYNEDLNEYKKKLETINNQSKKMTANDFRLLRVIGKGGYGEVRVVQKRDDDKVYAMKTLKKNKMIEKNQIVHVKTERNLMVALDNWLLVKLFWSFQDDYYLYLVMEYCPGGDLMKILIKEDILSEDVTRFYMAECARAIHDLHEMDYVHRDLKPDNILIACDGHIKLSDFGLAKSFDDENNNNMKKSNDIITQYQNSLQDNDDNNKDDDENYKYNKTMSTSAKKARQKHKLFYSAVGTPNYIAPEVFSKQGYGAECDWWSLGVIMFESVVGFPPFYADTPIQTVRKIVNYQKTLQIPNEAGLSNACKDCIFKLICPPKKRMDFHAIKRHPWFSKVPWHELHKMNPPFVPRIKGPSDTRYFDKLEGLTNSLEKIQQKLLEDNEKKADDINNQNQQNNNNTNKMKIKITNEDNVNTDNNALSVDKSKNHFDGFTFERKTKTYPSANSLFDQ